MSIETLGVGATILPGHELSIDLSVRADRDESELERLVAGARTESERIDNKCRSAHGVSAHEALERLERVKRTPSDSYSARVAGTHEVDAEPR